MDVEVVVHHIALAVNNYLPLVPTTRGFTKCFLKVINRTNTNEIVTKLHHDNPFIDFVCHHHQIHEAQFALLLEI